MIAARTVQAFDLVSKSDCAGCNGTKQAPLATIVTIAREPLGFTFTLCEECGRDLANAVGFMCVRDGGWSKIEARKRSQPAKASTDRWADGTRREIVRTRTR